MPKPERAIIASIDEVPRTRKEWHEYVRGLGRPISFSGFDKRCSSMGLEKAVTYTIEDPWTPWNAKGLCAKGHKVEGDNAYVRPNLLADNKPRRPKCKLCMIARSRAGAQKKKKGYDRPVRTECAKGHKLTPQNTRIQTLKNGYVARTCKECHRIYIRERLRRKKLGLPTRTRRHSWLPLEETIRRYSRRQANGCVLWAGKYLKAKTPLIAHKDIGARLVRPYLWERMNGREFPQYWTTKPSCGDYRCIAQAHIIAKPRGEFIDRNFALKIRNGLQRAKRRRENPARPIQADPNSLTLARYAPQVRRHLLQRFSQLRKSADLDDIVQETLRRVHGYIRKNGIEHVPTLRIATNVGIDYIRKLATRYRFEAPMPEREEATVGDEADTDDVALSNASMVFADPSLQIEMYELAAKQRDYHTAMMKLLPARAREVFKLREQGLAPPQIAKALRVSLNTVEQHLSRAYAKIRESKTGQRYFELLKQNVAA